MIERVARDRLAEALRQLAAGTITNDEYEEKAVEAIKCAQDEDADPALGAIYTRAWYLYTDIRTQRFRGKEKLSIKTREEIARWVTFLKSDAEYRWPIKSFLTLTGCLLQLVTLGLAGFLLRWKYERLENWTIWPFWTREQMSQALSKPIYLAGKR